MPTLRWWVALAVWLSGQAAAAQSLPAPEFSASLQAGIWSSSRNLDDERTRVPAVAWLKLGQRLGDEARLQAEGLAGSEFDSRGTRGLWREAYVDWSRGWFDLRLGRQIVAWGRADRLNPTDNLTPRDLTMLAVDDDDQRRGRFGATAKVHWGGHTLAAHYFPRFASTRLPNPSGIPYETRRHSDDFAVKFESEGGSLDWSVSYYHGQDPNPDLTLASGGTARPTPVLVNRRIRVWGADAALNVGGNVIRGEAAYSRTEDREGNSPLSKNSSFYIVMGLDQRLPADLSLNSQLFWKRVYGTTSEEDGRSGLPPFLVLQSRLIADQRDPDRYGYLVRLARKWLNDTIDAELSMLQSFPRHDRVIRGKLSYAIDDNWRMTLGVDRFSGPEDSYYGRLHRNSVTYLAIRGSF